MYDERASGRLEGGVNGYAYVSNNPLKYTDPLGLIKWSGTVFTIAGGMAGWDLYTLTSECKCGYRAIARVSAMSASYGRGFTFAGSTVTLEDNQSCVDPYILEGGYLRISAGAAAGLGYGYNFIVMGGARSPGSFGWQGGFDLSAGSSVGQATVEWATKEKCCN